MPALAIRDDIGSEELRLRARRESDGRVIARLIAIANALEGMDRASDERVLRVMEERDQLSREAAALILDRIGPELGRFLAITEGISWYELRDLLKGHWVDERGH